MQAWKEVQAGLTLECTTVSDALVETVVLNLPNFIFAGMGLFVLYKINERLMSILDRLCEPCDEEERKANTPPSKGNL